ncbi:sensor histidine kinase [Paenibacillus sp. WLX2291]|uniref:sensor histidine kinase n=1 Tax=Paenibacillus sp. WLX2291 TaxID=3296934 RepID=UPI003983DE24
MNIRHHVRAYVSKWNLFLLLSVNLFLLIVFILIVIALQTMTMIRLGWVQNTFYEHPIIPVLGVAFIVSVFIGISVLIMIDKMLIRPIHQGIAAMNDLAAGRFDRRIMLDGSLHTVEIRKFADSYNQAAIELSRVELLRKDFINNFSHEFKTPILSIKGFAELLREGSLPEEESREYLDIVIHEADRLSLLATRILELSQLGSERLLADRHYFSISEQVRRAIVMMEARWTAKQLEFALELDELEYYGNAGVLKQVWVNILDNAVKFSPDGAVIVAKVYREAGSIYFQVCDKGPGMDEHTLAHVFDQFYQGDSSHASEGNGLGMTIVRKIVYLHGGQIELDSEVGVGTTVTVVLPEVSYS